MQQIPFDFKASLLIKNWQQNFSSMLSEKKFESFFSRQEEIVIDYISQLESGKKKNIYLLSLPYIISRFNGLLLASKIIEQAEFKNIEYISTIPEVNFLKTGDKSFLTNKTKQILIEKPLKTYFLRRIVRTLTWTKWYKLPLAILVPDVIAVGHNAPLRRKAQLSNKRVFFYQASALLEKINSNYKSNGKADFLDKINNEIYNLLIQDLVIEDIYKKRFDFLVKDFISKTITSNFHALEACYQYKKLPNNIWMGTGGGYVFRLLALSVLYKGGKVTGFSHSTTPVMSPASKKMILLQELAVVSEFVCISPKAKNIIEAIRTKNISPKISCIDGEPIFKKHNKVFINNNNKLTIVYTGASIYCLDINPMFSNAMIYLDWQLRLTDMLDKMNINLICQPHPYGVFKDKTLIHPLLEKYNTAKRSFEAIMHKADVFLIDTVYSTVFGKMALTNKPIVRISLMDESSRYGIRDDNIDIINNRCRTVNAFFDEKSNLPYVDIKQLETALTHNWQEKVDATEFRELLLG